MIVSAWKFASESPQFSARVPRPYPRPEAACRTDRTEQPEPVFAKFTVKPDGVLS